ncbi:MAG: response regulator [Candidatus Sulfotelmatobacter sp.]
MTVLVIEDSRFLRFALERILVKAGHSIIAVGNGQEGLRLAQETRPDVILLDMLLPTLEGIEVLRRLKANPITQPIPVIVLSSLSQRNENKLKMAGAAAYFEKSKLNLEEDGSVLLEAVEHLRADQIASPEAAV